MLQWRKKFLLSQPVYSEILAKECEKGARDAGHDVEFLSLRGKDIRFCIGCLSCQKTGSCVLKDDVPEIMAKVKAAEVVVFATPIYAYIGVRTPLARTFSPTCTR